MNDPRWHSYSSVFSQATLSQSCQSRTAESSLCSVPKLSYHALCLRGTSDPTLCRTRITLYATGIRISVAVLRVSVDIFVQSGADLHMHSMDDK